MYIYMCVCVCVCVCVCMSVCVYLIDGQKTNKSADIGMKCNPLGGLGSTVQQ